MNTNSKLAIGTVLVFAGTVGASYGGYTAYNGYQEVKADRFYAMAEETLAIAPPVTLERTDTGYALKKLPITLIKDDPELAEASAELNARHQRQTWTGVALAVCSLFGLAAGAAMVLPGDLLDHLLRPNTSNGHVR